MAYNDYIVGQNITLSDSVTNALGALTDDSTESLLIYKPDGTTAAPAVVHGTTGQYSASFTPDQAGRHEYVFTSTGAASGRGRGLFYVSKVP